MRIYAETNFVLELALQQGELSFCEELLGLANRQEISLVLPAFSVFEPRYKIDGNGRIRRELIQRVEQQAHELGRTRGYEEKSREISATIQVFAALQDQEEANFSATLNQLVTVCRFIPMTADIVSVAMQESRLSFPDALVFASVIGDLHAEKSDESCFVTKNSKDFGQPDIVGELEALGCKTLHRFEYALGFAQKR